MAVCNYSILGEEDRRGAPCRHVDRGLSGDWKMNGEFRGLSVVHMTWIVFPQVRPLFFGTAGALSTTR